MAPDTESVPDDEFLRVAALLPDPVFTAGEVTDALPISRQAVNSRLNRFEEERLIKSKKVGASAVVYWLTDIGRQKLAQEAFKWYYSDSQ